MRVKYGRLRLSNGNPLIYEVKNWNKNHEKAYELTESTPKCNITPIWICQQCTYKNVERKLHCIICNFPFSKNTLNLTQHDNDNEFIGTYNHSSITLNDYLKNTELLNPENSDDSKDELLQIAIAASLNEYVSSYKPSKQRKHKKRKSKRERKQEITTKTEIQNIDYVKLDRLLNKNKNEPFEVYWNELQTKYKHLYNPTLRPKYWYFKRIDNKYDNKQLMIKSPYGTIPTFTKYLLDTRYNGLTSYIPTIKTLMRAMKPSKSYYYTYHYNFKPIFDADCMKRFMHRIVSRKTYGRRQKLNKIGLVFTFEDLDDLEEQYCVKSHISSQNDDEIIKFYGKDLLIYGFIRKYSFDTVPDDVTNLCLLFYHINGKQYEYQVNYKVNQHVRCYPYRDCTTQDISICLARVWDDDGDIDDHEWHYYEGREILFHNLCPLYKMTVTEKRDESTMRYWGCDWRPARRYIDRKWSAYHKLDRLYKNKHKWLKFRHE